MNKNDRFRSWLNNIKIALQEYMLFLERNDIKSKIGQVADLPYSIKDVLGSHIDRLNDLLDTISGQVEYVKNCVTDIDNYFMINYLYDIRTPLANMHYMLDVSIVFILGSTDKQGAKYHAEILCVVESKLKIVLDTANPQHIEDLFQLPVD